MYARLAFDPRRRVLALSQTWMVSGSSDNVHEMQLEDVEGTAREYLVHLELHGHLSKEMEPDHGSSKKIAIGGWSYGGVIALEVSRPWIA